MTSLGDMEDDASLMDDLMFSRGGDYSNDALRVVYDADSDVRYLYIWLAIDRPIHTYNKLVV